ncbi:MAG: hypothetical protein A3I66_15105 [Burkholderiales bacterium RIFCSPLOWO2_02_FULL_57_36]|nr:MAG: hypothetical protein A3I66_15105 [Burkholderiales bacterium RIFCSPLOWO2_02_FULL_57_36]
MSGLPTTWRSIALDKLIQKIEAGLNVKCEERPPRNGEKGLVKISAVTWGRFNQEQSKTLPANAEVNETARISAGDLLISRANTIELVGASVIVGSINKQLYLSDKVLRLVVPNDSKRWINYALKLPSVRKAIEESSSGNQLSMRNISQDKLRSIEIPLAPHPEQKRIADKLDTVLARVDACRERLNRVPLILKRFRQSVLAAGMSGSLTTQWRHRSGHMESNEIKTLSEIAGVIDPHPSHRTPSLVVNGVPYVGIGEVDRKGNLNLLAAKTVSWDVYEDHKSRYQIRDGDFMFGKIGTLGRPTRLPADEKYVVSANVILIQPNPEKVDPAYLLLFFSSPKVLSDIAGQASSTSQAAFGIKKMRSFPLSLPTKPEQEEVVRRVKILLAFADRLEARLATAQTTADRLTPALLAKAFRGELVPQDPNDELAAELLKRLTAARESAPKGKRSSKSNSTVAEKA